MPSTAANRISRPPPTEIPRGWIRIGSIHVSWVEYDPLVKTVLSPVDPKKQLYEHNIVFPTSLSFGIQDGEKSIIVMESVQSRDELQVNLNLTRKELDIQFPFHVAGRDRKLKFRLPIAHLPMIHKTNMDKVISLHIPFNTAPQFFVQKIEGEALIEGDTHTSFFENENRWTEWNTWFRTTDIVDDSLQNRLKDLPLMHYKDHALLDIGQWTSYILCFDEAIMEKSLQFHHFLDALNDFGVKIEDTPTYTIKNKSIPRIWTLLQEEVSSTHSEFEITSSTSEFDSLFIGQTYLAFPVRYQLEVCLSNGYLKEHTVTQEFLHKLDTMENQHAIRILEVVAENQRVIYDPMDIFQIQVKKIGRSKHADHYMLQRSAVITPSSVHVNSPIMDISNRITRRHSADADRFIRVRFSDEKIEGVLRNMPNNRAEAIYERVRRAVEHGIVIAGRHYEFLAFGNSQFREYGAYFYAPTSTNSADDIRASLGDFSHIKSVAKFAARIGQCFSTTREMGHSVQIEWISDIERNDCCFTDGVGKVSPFLAKMAVHELGLRNHFEDPPSVCQFRMGGCKGVLAVDPNIKGKEVHIRPSQRKFEALCKGLEFIRFSSFATPFFNRQIIIVLSSLGVPDDVFIAKQQAMLSSYESAMHDERTAIRKLKTNVDVNHTTLTMARMILDGFMEHRDPFIISLLRLWRAVTIKGLKEKARIAIDNGAFLLGCVDETATLRGHYDDPQSRPNATKKEKLETLPEIFVQIDNFDKPGCYKVIEGVCILARNPSLHPGDLRIVRAVDVPALHHLKNVVVLPQTGERDLASMCSGGDLDGDDFMILWDRDLLSRLQTINHPPMDFTADTPLQKQGNITVEDIGRFFVTYMKNDTLGTIANAHLAHADWNREGVLSDICLELAKLHSQAVDYPKSGIPATMDRDKVPNKYPHFMEKRHLPANRNYRSESVLGKLYDLVELVDFKPAWECSFDKRIIDAYDGDEAVLAKARALKEAYDRSLKHLMVKYGIRTDFEAWSIFILDHNQGKRGYKLAEEFGSIMEVLKVEHRNTCLEAAGVKSVAESDRFEPFVAAMYTVTAQEMEAALCTRKERQKGEDMPFISFPWLFPAELGKLANRKVKEMKVDTQQP